MSEVPTSRIEEQGRRSLPHDPRLSEIVTRVDYELPAALSELVDNSVDAGARNVLVRFIRNTRGLSDLLIIDDGRGISDDTFDESMRFARQRTYSQADTGMYGIGMKSASLAMAEVLTVVAQANGSRPAGRRWTRSSSKQAELIELKSRYCEEVLDSLRSTLYWTNCKSGVCIRWGQVDDFLRAQGDRSHVNRYAQSQMQRIEHHLGLTFHRLIARANKSLTIHLDIQDEESREVFDHRTVPAIDPFGYPKSGARGYPKTFRIETPGTAPLAGRAHIWPKGIKGQNFKIPRGNHSSAAESQGLYIYRSDRLLMAGGWKGIKNPEDHQSLARMEIDLPPKGLPGMEVTFNKTNVNISSTVAEAVRNSRADDGTTFDDWLQKAIAVNRTQLPKAEKIDLPIPTSGIPTAVRDTFAAMTTSDDEIEVGWKNMSPEIVFRVSSRTNSLLINSKYRSAFNVGGGTGSKSTALPLTLLIVACRDLVGKRRTQKVASLTAALQQIFLAAIREQEE